MSHTGYTKCVAEVESILRSDRDFGQRLDALLREPTARSLRVTVSLKPIAELDAPITARKVLPQNTSVLSVSSRTSQGAFTIKGVHQTRDNELTPDELRLLTKGLYNSKSNLPPQHSDRLCPDMREQLKGVLAVPERIQRDSPLLQRFKASIHHKDILPSSTTEKTQQLLAHSHSQQRLAIHEPLKLPAIAAASSRTVRKSQHLVRSKSTAKTNVGKVRQSYAKQQDNTKGDIKSKGLGQAPNKSAKGVATDPASPEGRSNPRKQGYGVFTLKLSKRLEAQQRVLKAALMQRTESWSSLVQKPEYNRLFYWDNDGATYGFASKVKDEAKSHN